MVEKKKDANKAKVAREISKIWGGLESDQIATLKEHVEITKYKKGEFISAMKLPLMRCVFSLAK